MSRAWIMFVVVALAGACTMTIELSAVRLLAPWFGTSSSVWTNVIGVVLLSLSAGYMCGAWLSAGAAPAQRLAWTLFLAAIVTAWTPRATGFVAGVFMPAGLTIEEAVELMEIGSLAAALVLFVPATLLLGCIPPLASEVVQRATQKSAGDVGGRVLAASTIGSIAGTFVTTYVALPVLGLSRTFWVAACVLAGLGGVIWIASRSRGSRAVWLLWLPVALAWRGSEFAPPPPPDGCTVLERTESSYQSLRVIEREDDGRRMRFLQVNEGLDSFQSVWQDEPGLLPAGYYYNLFVLPGWWTRPTREWNVLALGLGAGTVWRVLDGASPQDFEWHGIGVEIDSKVVDLGRKWFALAEDRGDREVLGGVDGRVATRHLTSLFDLIVLDAYANQTEIPVHLSSRECFLTLRDRLAPDGWLCINVGGFGLKDPVVSAVAGAVAASFGARVLVVRVPFSRNCVVFARRAGAIPTPNEIGWVVGDPAIDAMLASLAIPGAWEWVLPDSALPRTDDRNDLDRLQRRSLAAAAARRVSEE